MAVAVLMKHRGALQAQGADIKTNGGTVSRGWAEAEPYKADAAHKDLAHVRSCLSKAQQTAREIGFQLARVFIERARAKGGLTATGRKSHSFPKLKPDEAPDIRVDIEIKSGTAFV